MSKVAELARNALKSLPPARRTEELVMDVTAAIVEGMRLMQKKCVSVAKEWFENGGVGDIDEALQQISVEDVL